MRRRHNKKVLKISFIVLIAVLALGIGYAGVSAINLLISSNGTATVNQSNFRVRFLNEGANAPTIEGSPTNTVSVISDTEASFSILTLDGKGESVTANLKVKNESNGIGAKIKLKVANTNNDNYIVTTTVEDKELQAGDMTTVTVKVEMLRTPVDNVITSNVTVTLIATPIDNNNATSNNPITKNSFDPYVYSVHERNVVGEALKGTPLSYDEAMSIAEWPAVNAHIIENGLISKSYVVFEIDDEIFYLQGDKSEWWSEERPIYDKNVEVVKKAIGPDWQSVCDDNNDPFSCNFSRGGINYEILIGTYYGAIVNIDDWGCYSSDSSYCGRPMVE